MPVFHRVDRIVFWLLILGGLFVALMTVTGDNMPLSAAASACACLGLRRLFNAINHHVKTRGRKARRRYARSLMKQWLFLSEAKAKEKIAALTDDLPADGAFCLLPLSPTYKAFDADTILSIWKKSQSETHITLAAFCPATVEAKQWAKELKNPRVTLLDGPFLERRIVDSCPVVPASFREEKRPTMSSDWVGRLLRQVHPVRAGLYALSLLALYLLGGGLLRLVGFGAFCALALISAGRREAA